MATPLPFPGLSAILGTYGKALKSRDAYSLPPDERPTVAAMIPALNEERTLPYALASLAMQTVTPTRVVVVDDGSTDDTTRIVHELAEELDLTIELRRHEEPMGKTVGVKEVARSIEADTLFVLDADTFLESEDYLESLLTPHVESSVASSFGTVYPIETASKEALYETYVSELLPEDSVTRSHVRADIDAANSETGVLAYLTGTKPIVQFRNIQYHVEQRFFADGFMRLFGSTLFPVGCGALYDREKLVSVFDDFEESHGNDLTNSEDIFVGFAFCDRGWENVHLHDTYMRSAVPGLRGTLEQNYLWGSGFLQSAYYFKGLSFRRRARRLATDGGTGETTRKPMGWAVLARVIDGLYPTTIFVLLVLAHLGFVALEIVGFLVLWEFSLYTLIGRVTRSKRLHFYRNLVPFFVVRVLTLPVLSYTYFRVGADIVTGNRDWRK